MLVAIQQDLDSSSIEEQLQYHEGKLALTQPHVYGYSAANLIYNKMVTHREDPIAYYRQLITISHFWYTCF